MRLILLVGARGFEPPTPCAQGRCATGLRYAPTLYLSDSKLLPPATQRPLTSAWQNRDKTPGWAETVSKYSELRSRHRKANSSKRSLVKQLEFCAGLAGAKLMISLVVDHLVSTCFRGAQDPAVPGRPRVPPTSRLARASVDRVRCRPPARDSAKPSARWWAIGWVDLSELFMVEAISLFLNIRYLSGSTTR